jgi:hypothetical protein
MARPPSVGGAIRRSGHKDRSRIDSLVDRHQADHASGQTAPRA